MSRDNCFIIYIGQLCTHFHLEFKDSHFDEYLYVYVLIFVFFKKYHNYNYKTNFKLHASFFVEQSSFRITN